MRDTRKKYLDLPWDQTGPWLVNPRNYFIRARSESWYPDDGWLLRFPLPLLIAACHSPFCTRLFHPNFSFLVPPPSSSPSPPPPPPPSPSNFHSFISPRSLPSIYLFYQRKGRELFGFSVLRTSTDETKTDRWIGPIQVYRGYVQPVLIDAATLPLREERRVDSLRMSQPDGIRVIHLLPLRTVGFNFRQILFSFRQRDRDANSGTIDLSSRSNILGQGSWMANDDDRAYYYTDPPIVTKLSKLSIIITRILGQDSRSMDGENNCWREIGFGRIWAGIDSG